MMAIEAAICQFRGRFRLTDALTSMSHANLLRVFEFIGEKHLSFVVYAYIFENFRFLSLDGKNVWVWFLAGLMNDHGYYWEHRFLHETHIGWAAHQVHHSSQGKFECFAQWWVFVGFPIPRKKFESRNSGISDMRSQKNPIARPPLVG